MQARYYDPVIGRFYSNDPVGFIGHAKIGKAVHGFNRYTYANNNPYRYTDPTGKVGMETVRFDRISGEQAIQVQKQIGEGVVEATGIPDAIDSVKSALSGDLKGAVTSAVMAVVKPAKGLKVLNKKQLKKMGIDAEAFKADEVGSKQGAKFNMAADGDGNVSLVPVKKGAGDPVPTNIKLDEVAEHYPLEKKG